MERGISKLGKKLDMEFERGKDIKKTIGIGLNAKPEAGKKLLIRFKFKRGREKYEPFVELEEQGKPVLALVKAIKPDHYDAFDFDLITNRLVCIINGIPHEEFIVGWNEEEQYWETKFRASRHGV